MVYTISEEFYKSLPNKPNFNALTEFHLDIYAGGGTILPYTGYIEVEVEIPRSDNGSMSDFALVLVTETT